MVENKEIEDVLEYLKKSKIDTEKKPKSPEELRQTIRENLKLEKEAKERDKKRIETLDKISEFSKIEIPKILIEAEKEKMLGELKVSIENMGMKWGDYLKHIKKSEEDLKNGWQDDALRRVKHGLILREIANKKNIGVSEQEIEQKISQILKSLAEEDAKRLDQNRLKDYAYGVIRNEKVFQLLEQS
jgi:FKBP-type peptidyl-prolyl cis-trans isomerase (trigger factor)